MEQFKIFTLNIGSTSTKVALFENTKKIYEASVKHDPKILKDCGTVIGQKEYRMNGIIAELESAGITLDGLDAVSARCGGTGPIPGGTYEVNQVLLDRLTDKNLHHHNADLGGIVAAELAAKYNTRAFFVDSPETDELEPVARITGMKGVYKVCSTHTLNQKAAARFYAADINKKYEDLNLIVAHIGGGVSVSAHRKGLIIESTNLIKGDGPMAPTRCGEMQAMTISDMAFSGKYGKKELEDRINMTGGLMDHLGTADVLEIKDRIKNAELIYNAFIYQISKYIGMMGAVLEGKIDAIILTGGISRDDYLAEKIRKSCGFLAPVVQIAGEFEMEALAAGAYRVLSGSEAAKEYTGKLVFNGVEDLL